MQHKFVKPEFTSGVSLTGRNIMIILGVLNNNDWDKIYSDIKNRRIFSKEEIMFALSQVKGKTFTILDDEYPQFFKSQYTKPPFVIFLDERDRSRINDQQSLGYIKEIRLNAPEKLEKEAQ